MNTDALNVLLLEALEAERGGSEVYRAALECAIRPDLRSEWSACLEQTERHERILLATLDQLGVDPYGAHGRGRVVRHLTAARVEAMRRSRALETSLAAQAFAARCVLEAGARNQLDWELLAFAARHLDGRTGELLREACAEVADEEDVQLLQAQGWARELQVEALGLGPVLPPPELDPTIRAPLAAAQREARASATSLPQRDH